MEPLIFKFAYFHHFDDKIKSLGEGVAEKEPWDFSSSKIANFSILKNYLNYYFKRLKEESKIKYTKNNKFAAFNTGLVTSNQEPIFCLFSQYEKKPEYDHIKNPAPYVFQGFAKMSDDRLLSQFGRDLPETANFFEKPELLIFNPLFKIVPDIDHIILDNKTRFPAHLQSADDKAMRRQLHGAIEDVTKKVKTNYKIAIPQYYDGRIQLLLPLHLTSGSPNPDLALVIHRVPDQDIYSAKTCLTLEMAYNNARLIVKPQSEWLKP